MIKVILSIIVILDVLSKLPQIIKLLEYKNADSISVLSYTLWNFSSVLYLIYCLSIREWPLFFETLLNFTFNTIILCLSCYYNKQRHGRLGFKYEIKKMVNNGK